jgi:hypothetical protein
LPKKPPDVVVVEAPGAAEDAAAPNGLDVAVVLLLPPKRPPPLDAAGLAALPKRPPPDAGCCCWPNGEAAGVPAAPVFPPRFPNRPLPPAEGAAVDPLRAPVLPNEKLGVPVEAAPPKSPPEAGAVVVVAC